MNDFGPNGPQGPRRPGPWNEPDTPPEPSFDQHDPTAPPQRLTFVGAYVTVALIAVMTLLEFAAMSSDDIAGLLLQFGAFQPLVVWGVWEGALPPWELSSLIAHAFLHGGLMHLAFNMMAMAILAPPVERSLGSPVYLVVFLLLAIGGGLGHAAWEWGLYAMIEDRGVERLLTPLVGASGAIFGFLGLDLGRRAKALAAIPPAYRTASPGGYLRKASIGVLIVNAAFMVMDLPISGAAHLGGYFMGLLLAAALYRKGGDRAF